MASKVELLKQAQELGLDVTEKNTVAEINAALDKAASEANEVQDVPPQTQDEPEEETKAVESDEERAAREAAEKAAEEAAAEARAKEEAEYQEMLAEQARLEAEAKKEAAASEGSEIARAISEGLKGAVEAAKSEKKILIKSDPNVRSRFSLVRNRQGEVLLRENATNHLSKLQLESLEEKEQSIQNQEVEEI